MYNLMLDDSRDLSYFGYDIEFGSSWVLAKTSEEAKAIIADRGIPEEVSLDHDLGPGESGMDFVKWLVEKDMEEDLIDPMHFSFIVHSSNVEASHNMKSYLSNYLRLKLNRLLEG